MATKKKTTKKKATKKSATDHAHVEVVEIGPTADRKTKLWSGCIKRGSASFDLGTVACKTKTEARASFDKMLRKMK